MDDSLPLRGRPRPVFSGPAKCKLCDLRVNSEEQWKIHCRSNKHKHAQQLHKLQKRSQAAEGSGAAADSALVSTGAFGKAHIRSTSPIEAAVAPREDVVTGLRCNVCQIDATSDGNLQAHLQGKQHKKKLEQANRAGGADSLGRSEFHCHICEIGMNSADSLKAHESGRQHQRKVELKQLLESTVVTHGGVSAGTGVGEVATSESAPPLSVGDAVTGLRCNICKIDASSADNLKAHLDGKNHRKKMEQVGRFGDDSAALGEFYCHVCGIGSTSKTSFDIHCQGKKHQKNVTSTSSNPAERYYCSVCSIQCTAEAAYDDHCKGKSHVKKCREAGVALPASLRQQAEERAHPPLVLSPDSVPIPAVLTARQLRDYQIELYRQALTDNRVLYLPTGMGKTLLGTCVLSHMLQINPTYQVVFLVDRVLLVVQQAKAIRLELADVRLSGDKPVTVAALSGGKMDLDSNMPQGSERDHSIIVATAGSFLNCLEQKVLFWRDMCCVVIDEVHHCGKRHPFHVILRKNYHTPDAHKPRIVGLTASPAGQMSVDSTMKQLNDLLSRMEAKLGTVVNHDSKESYKQFLRRAELRCAIVSSTKRHIDETQLVQAMTRKEDGPAKADARAGAAARVSGTPVRSPPPAVARSLSSEDEKYLQMLRSIEQYLEEALRMHSGCGTCGKDMASLSTSLSENDKTEQSVKDTMMAVVSITSRSLNEPHANFNCHVPFQHFQSVAVSWLDVKQRRGIDELKKLSDKNNAFGFEKAFSQKLKSQQFIHDYLDEFLETAAATALSKLSMQNDEASYDENSFDDDHYMCGDEDDDVDNDFLFDYNASGYYDDDDDYIDGGSGFEDDLDDMLDFCPQIDSCEEESDDEEELTEDAKQKILDKIIDEVLKLPDWRNEERRPIALVLVKDRKEALELKDSLNDSERLQKLKIRTLQIIGQGNRGNTEGMTVKKQAAAMASLHEGHANIAVCTSVAEEGLDLPHCSLVIKTRCPPTVPSLVQSWGRARAHGATFFVICASIIEQEKVMSLLEKEKNMEKAAEQLAAEGKVV